jgi:carbamate kinase
LTTTGFSGVEAVIDKDLSSALLAQALHADRLLLLTDVDAVYSEWGSSSASPLVEVKPSWLRKQSFEPGSMGPKVETACRFVEQTGNGAVIGRLADAMALLEGSAECQTDFTHRALSASRSGFTINSPHTPVLRSCHCRVTTTYFYGLTVINDPN